jgi:predicted small secreted protein
MTRRYFAFALLLYCLFILGCETIKGVGRDIENTGEVLSDAIPVGKKK